MYFSNKKQDKHLKHVNYEVHFFLDLNKCCIFPSLYSQRQNLYNLKKKKCQLKKKKKRTNKCLTQCDVVNSIHIGGTNFFFFLLLAT